MYPNRVPARARILSIGGDVLVFAVSLSAFFYIQLVGTLFISEIILAVLLPVFLALRFRSVFRPGLRGVFVMIGLWLVGQVFSDAFNRTATTDRLRGYSLILFFAIDLIGLAALLGKNERRKVIFAAGFALSSLLGTWFEPQPRLEISADPWKWGYSQGVNLAVVLVITFLIGRGHHLLALIPFAGIVLVNLLENYRSPIVFFLITAALTVQVIPERIGGVRILPRAGSTMRVIVLCMMAIGGAVAADSLIRWASSTGLVGEEAKAKNLGQEQSKNGLLLGGRPEILVSSRAVMESPIIGHGAWARDPKYVEMLYDIQFENGFKMNRGELQEAIAGVIPCHSYLMQAWVWAGILGAAFWVYILWLIPKALARNAALRPPLAPLYAWLLVSLFWAIMFSPFANTGRMTAALCIVIIVDLLEKKSFATGAIRMRRVPRSRTSLRTRPPLAAGGRI